MQAGVRVSVCVCVCAIDVGGDVCNKVGGDIFGVPGDTAPDCIARRSMLVRKGRAKSPAGSCRTTPWKR